MTEKLKRALDETWTGVRPERYRNGGSFGRRDIVPALVVFLVCISAWYVHDVSTWELPLPSKETMLFIGFLWGVYRARRFRP